MLIRLKIFILIVLGAQKILSAQPEHFLHCISVKDNSDILIEWESFSNNASFVNYEVYHSNIPTSSFSIIATIEDISVNIYLHMDQDPVTSNNFYFVKINKNDSPPSYSDTLQAIKLRMIPQPFNSRAYLTWNALHSPKMPSSNQWYRIFKKYSYAGWKLIDSTKNQIYIDTIQVCYDTINYKIKNSNTIGCASVSNVYGDWLQDLTQPPVPYMDSVSIDNDGNAILGWEVSSDSGTMGYIVYRNQAGIWSTLDTVFGIGNTFYTDSTANACIKTRSYGIAAIDSCGNKSGRGISPENLGDSLKTILFNAIEFKPCEKTNTLSWTEYINMFPGLKGYKIYVSENNTPFEILNVTSPSQTSYIHQNTEPFVYYRYFIRAYNNHTSSTSCVQSVTTYYPDTPEYIYLRAATVRNNEDVHLTIYTDSTVSVKGYKILRADNASGPFSCIDTLKPSSYANISFTDNNVNVDAKSYYYKIEVIDSCGNEDITSNFGRTILLNIDSPSDERNVLSWNDYELWDGNVIKYDIYREDNQAMEPELIASVPFGVNTYTDMISGQIPATGNFQYFVEAIEGEGYEYTFQDTSRSNKAVANQESYINVPNAFAPKGINNIFKPVIRYVEPNGYSLKIFNRWGEMIFETNNPATGWNGRYKGEYVPMGIYVYYICYQVENKTTRVKKGTITLIY